MHVTKVIVLTVPVRLRAPIAVVVTCYIRIPIYVASRAIRKPISVLEILNFEE